MPADIRRFFGGQPPTNSAEHQQVELNKNRKSRRVIEDSDDDDEIVPKKLLKDCPPRRKKAKNENSEAIAISTSDYFASKYNSGNINMIQKMANASGADAKETSQGQSNVISPVRTHDQDTKIMDERHENQSDGCRKTRSSNGLKKESMCIEILSDDEEAPKIKKDARRNVVVTAAKNATRKAKSADKGSANTIAETKNDTLRVEPSDKIVSRKKQASVEIKSDDQDFNTSVKSVKPVKQKSQIQKNSKALKNEETETSSVQAILDSISTIRAPSPPPKDPDAKWNWKNAQAEGNNGPVLADGTKKIPEGQENCLAGLTFVFTGMLDTLAREDAQELIKRYGGKVTGAPSRRTSFVVLGDEAGPSKLKKIKELSLKSINEDGLFELIRAMPSNGGDSKAAEKNLAKKKAEMEKIEIESKKMEQQEKKMIQEAEAAAKVPGTILSNQKQVLPLSQLWTSKYAPTSMNQICGNKGAVEKIQNWLKGWQLAHKYNFQKRGPDGLGGYRTIMIHGPPGIGKTTAAHLAAKLAGYDVIEGNASDTRSKKLVESGLSEVMNNKSLFGYFSGHGKPISDDKKNILLIMDEVDGMSAGDRGGVGALAQVCRKTNVPMILICNERKQPKMKPFDIITCDIPFRRPTVEQVRSRVATICHREGLKMAPNVMDALIEGSNKDIRQIINMISAAKLDQSAMDYDQSKAMSKAWEKHVVLKPWDICHKLLGGGLFTPNSKATLNDKIELYFNDHEFSYLMVQENYLSTKPFLVNEYVGKKSQLKALQLIDDAAQSISDGDLVDRMIHGSQQQWSLMPTHAVFSAIRPASFVSGVMTERTSFTQWLGNNSKYQKLARYVKEIQAHMRLRTAGTRHEIRQQYLPVLWAETVKRLENEGKECVGEVIDLMDSYFLTRDDFDYITELGIGPQDFEKVHIDTQTKSTFTRIYNQRKHPLPFMKASNVAMPTRITKEAPDLEEAFEEEDDGAFVADPVEEEAGVDLKKDKYIKQPKKPAAKKPTKKRNREAEESEEDNHAKKKTKAKPKASTRKKAS